MKKYFLVFLFYFFIVPNAKAASCDIQPIAQGYLNDIYNYVNFGFEKPSLAISDDSLTGATGSDIKKYGKVQHSRGFIASQLDFDQNKITIFSHIFDGHATCDSFVIQKLKRLVTHEYTHHLDQNNDLSNIASTKNMETTAIIGENTLPRMVWGKRNPMVLRELTRKEKKKAAKLRRFVFRYKD